MHRPDVSICIPAWQAEPFIDRTLHCVRAQTHAAIRILVSIDASHDKTAEICRAHARADPRISVFEQESRLGWVGNSNFLLDRVDTEFHCLYMHDDVIEPEFAARLVSALRQRPDAASAHCDVGLFGAYRGVTIGRNYEGGAVRRLCTFLVAPNRGSPLRSMTRRDVAGDLRLPDGAPDGLWANEPYLMKLVAAGPAVRVPAVLYRRWHLREGGLVRGWDKLTPEQMKGGLRINASAALSIVNAIPASSPEREALTFCAHLFLIRKVRKIERTLGTKLFAGPENLHESFAGIHPPPGLAAIGPEIERWALTGNSALGGGSVQSRQ